MGSRISANRATTPPRTAKICRRTARRCRRRSRGDDEYDALRAASWLIEREFDAPVRVERAADADESVVRKAEPGRPAIDIVE